MVELSGRTRRRLARPKRRYSLFHNYFRAQALMRRRPATVVAAGPHPIVEWFLPWKIGQLLNLRFRPPDQAPEARLGLWFELTIDPPIRRTPPDYFGDLAALNSGCADISKSRVMRINKEVFGYGYELDPLTHHGPMAAKSDRNGKHDGRVVEGPLAPEDVDPRLVYQRLIDASADADADADAMVQDFRVCVVGEEIPYVLRKQRPAEIRFSRTHYSAEPAPDEFTAEERAKLTAFSRRFGLDLGEIDVLRDAGDGRIYVVDVNNTPHSPPFVMPTLKAIPCMHGAADAFERQFLSGATGVAR